MKNYTFSIDVDLSHSGSSFMDELLSEVESEKKQLELTYKINRETTRIHKEILTDLISELDDLFENHDARFEKPIQDHTNNCYTNHYAICRFNNGFTCVIMVDGESDYSFKQSKYTTFTGKHRIKITRINERDRRMDGNPSYCSDLNGRVKNIDEVLDYIRHDLKCHIENNNR